jgi:hypothetical protein
MTTFSDDNPTNATRALQIWQILISKAHNRQTLTYGILANLLGFEGAGTLGRPLAHIMNYCHQNELPPLTVLVVNQETGLPGTGFTTTIDLHVEREAVFDYNWFGIVPPTPDELHNAFHSS